MGSAPLTQDGQFLALDTRHSLKRKVKQVSAEDKFALHCGFVIQKCHLGPIPFHFLKEKVTKTGKQKVSQHTAKFIYTEIYKFVIK